MSNEIVIVGSGFAGITAALELRRRLPAESLTVVTVVSASDDFTFLPSLIWVAQGSRELEDISFSARAVLEQAGVHFIRARQIPIVFLTPEPHLGHFGRGGMGNSQHLLEEVFARQGITWFANAQVTEVKPHAVFTQEHGRFESNFTMLVPPQRGIAAVRAVPGLANAEGYIAIDNHYRSQADNDIYAAGGAAVSLPPVAPTPLPLRTFIPGTVSAQMGRLAAANIAAALGYGRSEAAALESINSLYLMDTGAQGLFLSLGASSWINLQMSLPSPLGHWAKEVTEQQQMTRLKSGQY